MAHSWPPGTVFSRRVLDVEDRTCKACGHHLHVCGHRQRRLFTLQGPWQLVLKLVHCPQATCVGHGQTISPEAESAISMPWWSMGWDVFAWIGHRRLARHWSVPQIRGELRDSQGIELSADAVEKNIRRYQTMLAARHQDPERLRAAYADSPAVFLTIDGLQPEKGHETLYVVRELGQRRVWFAEPLLSSSQEEIRRLFVRAREMVGALHQTVSCWMSDKQEAFVNGIAAEFPGVPHRYCQNHFLRDVAKPVLEQDSHAKVQLRSKVRGLRAIEREVLPQQRQDQERVSEPEVAATRGGQVCSQPLPGQPAAEVVLDYCAAVRGILNDDQGGPMHPPGLRMAEALREVRQSLDRNIRVKKGGRAEAQLQRLAGCINRGLNQVEDDLQTIQGHVATVRAIQETLEPTHGSCPEREQRFETLRDQLRESDDPIQQQMAKVMASFQPGLFVGPDAESAQDNLSLERWFRLPKGHERRIHGHRHAGVRLVQEGPTLALALDAHLHHPEPFTPADLHPYRQAQPPPCQCQALARRKTMRKARSQKQRPILLAELEARYLDSS